MIQALTNEDYYNILLQGYNETLALYEAKEILSTDEVISDFETSGTVVYSDQFKNQLGIKLAKELSNNFYFHKEATNYFLNFLDRQHLILEKHQAIERSYFYKRCFLVLNIKLNEWSKEGIRILRGLNKMENPPNTLEFFEYYKGHIKIRSKQIEIVKPLEGSLLKKDSKDQKPFLTGLKFATGEAQELYKELYKKPKFSFNKLTIDLGFGDKERPYFSNTINGNKGVKNIYNRPQTIIEIHTYCIKYDIPMCDDFLYKYNQIELE